MVGSLAAYVTSRIVSPNPSARFRTVLDFPSRAPETLLNSLSTALTLAEPAPPFTLSSSLSGYPSSFGTLFCVDTDEGIPVLVHAQRNPINTFT
jgi:hypothetical protein